ncbi:MAG: glycosyltransferase, partial [Microbacterium sp.]|nr:glycosyltransferase [Microbacterium sp.]
MTTPATPSDPTPDGSPTDTPADAPADRPLTVLIGADTFLPHVNGAARFAERLAAGLVARGHDVHVAAPSVGHSHAGTFTEVIEGEPMTRHRLP